MNKYESAKVLKPTRARVKHLCVQCGEGIEKGEQYYRETLELMAKPPGLQLRAFCATCAEAMIARKVE